MPAASLRAIHPRGRREGTPLRFLQATTEDPVGKILRGTMRRIADGEDYTTPAAIDDPTTLGEMGDVLRELGYARSRASIDSA